MFFAKEITSIKPQDRVLEIGPGATPHPRSNAFLELKFETRQDKVAQRGGISEEPKWRGRPVHYYDGAAFPFKDKEFDYVICSHVIEHVDDPEFFINEIFRVGSGRGYLEYPLVTYEYVYGFEVHLNFVKFDFERRTLQYLSKSKTALSDFSAVQTFFQRTLECGWDDLVSANKKLFFEGFEFDRPFGVEETGALEKFLPLRSQIEPKKLVRKFLGCILNKMGF